MMTRNDREDMQVMATFAHAVGEYARAVRVRESRPEQSRFMRPLAEYAQDVSVASELVQGVLNSRPVSAA